MLIRRQRPLETGRLSLRIPTLGSMTFNSGTTRGVLGAQAGEADPDAYGTEQAALSDAWCGDGLAWQDAVDATAAFIAQVDPDIVAFQEIFWSEDCADIPPGAHPGLRVRKLASRQRHGGGGGARRRLAGGVPCRTPGQVRGGPRARHGAAELGRSSAP